LPLIVIGEFLLGDILPMRSDPVNLDGDLEVSLHVGKVDISVSVLEIADFKLWMQGFKIVKGRPPHVFYEHLLRMVQSFPYSFSTFSGPALYMILNPCVVCFFDLQATLASHWNRDVCDIPNIYSTGHHVDGVSEKISSTRIGGGCHVEKACGSSAGSESGSGSRAGIGIPARDPDPITTPLGPIWPTPCLRRTVNYHFGP